MKIRVTLVIKKMGRLGKVCCGGPGIMVQHSSGRGMRLRDFLEKAGVHLALTDLPAEKILPNPSSGPGTPKEATKVVWSSLRHFDKYFGLKNIIFGG